MYILIRRYIFTYKDMLAWNYYFQKGIMFIIIFFIFYFFFPQYEEKGNNEKSSYGLDSLTQSFIT